MSYPPIAAALWILFIFNSACPAAEVRDTSASIYDHFYPNYVEYCAGTEMEVYGKKIETGYGHAMLFLKGACLDHSAPYPKLKLSSSGTGVAVSVIPQFSNINWIGIEGRDMFFHACVPYDATYGQAEHERVIQGAIGHGLFKNVKLTPKDAAKIPEKYQGDMKKWAANLTFGICFGQSLVRTTHCIRIPMPPSVMSEVIKSLNERNEYYFESGETYKWFGLTDNCARPLHNALAAAGFWKPKPEGWIMPFALMQITAPANDFLTAIEMTFACPIPGLLQIIDDPTLLVDLMERSWLPVQSGTLLELVPFHSFRNTMWHTKPELDFARFGPFPNGVAKVHRYEERSDFRDLRLNLLGFRKRYQEIRTDLEQHPAEWYTRRHPYLRVKGSYSLKQVHTKYSQYIIHQLDDIEAMLHDPLLP
ncbi:MAG: hypothetical protein ABI318_01065 [Chthoniobacteraceae bacterium]